MATPEWISDRIPKFISAIAPLNDEIAIRQICEDEVRFLRRQLGIVSVEDDSEIVTGFKGKITSLHAYLTEYRNAVKFQIQCTDQNSFTTVVGKFKTKTSEGSRRKVQLHYAHRYLKKSTDEIQYRSQELKEHSDEKRRQPRYFYSDEVIEKAIALLDSEYFSHIALGLMLLTGRRMSEVLKAGKFEILDSDNVLFSGQLKTRDCPTAKTAPFKIPVLANSDLICGKLGELRQFPEIAELQDKPVKACNSKASLLGNSCKSHFGKLIKDCIPKDLRAAYAQICLVYRRPDRHQRTDYEPYFAEILGHAEDDLDTSKKYKIFELLD